MKIVVKAKEIVNDLRDGMVDSQLMEKYGLSPKGLQSVFKKLVDAKAIRPTELYNRAPIVAEDTADVESIREELREFVEVMVPIQDSTDPTNTGAIHDLSQNGLGVSGLKAKRGETKTLVVLADNFFPVDPFSLEGVCRWVKRTESQGIIESGFRITAISEENRAHLEELIRLLRIRE